MRTSVLLSSLALLLVGAETKDDATKAEQKKFEGTWVLISGERDGEKVHDEHIKKSKIVMKGKVATLIAPHISKETIKADLSIAPTKTPKEMDWVRSEGPERGKTMLAIYEFLEEDQYRVCFAPPGKERPKEFASKPGSGYTLHVWKRMKE